MYLAAGYYRVGNPLILKEDVSLIGQEEDLGSVVISGNFEWPVIFPTSHNMIKNLVIRDGEVGIYCNTEFGENPIEDIVIEHNLIIHNETGIYIRSDNVRVRYCTIAYNTVMGIYVYINPNGPMFYGNGNIIAFNGPSVGIEFVQKDESDLMLDAFLDVTSHTALMYNDLYDGLYHTWLDSNCKSKKRIKVPLDTFGLENISQGPCFFDANDYHLCSYSPCIDTGDPNSDYSLEPQPNGERVNLGFYGNTPQATPSIDTDNDGPYDYEEGTGDLDDDGLPDWQDGDTVILPVPSKGQKIYLHLNAISGDTNITLYFKDTNAILAPSLPVYPPEGKAPFDFVQFSVPGLDDETEIAVKIFFPESFKALGIGEYYALSKNGSWQSLPYEADANNNAICLRIKDGLKGDGDGTINGVVVHLGGLVLPPSIKWENPGTCLISVFPDFTDTRGSKGKPYLLFCGILGLFLFLALFYKKNTFVRKWPFFTLFIILSIVVFFTEGQAQLKEDIKIASSPNPVGSGARAFGMGGAFIASADDATAASWNPAGLVSSLTRPEFSFVGNFFPRREGYSFEKSPEASGRYGIHIRQVNYLSAAYPFMLFKKNLLFSLNYQHLYDFSKRISYTWRYLSDARDDNISQDIKYHCNYEQAGGLKALSPALSLKVNKSLSFGLTLNIWSDRLFNNEWISQYHKDGSGVIDTDRKPVLFHVDILERYSFSGLNFNLGALWDISRDFTFGVVYKSPFKADLEHSKTSYKTEEYLNAPSFNKYINDTKDEKRYLRMPQSYGIGIAYHPADTFVLDLDIYRTHWGDYELIEEDGRRVSPITGYSSEGVAVRSTYQVRLGTEYTFISHRDFIPTIRAGVFYDPEPAPNNPYDFYGVSLGFGLTVREKRGVNRSKNRKERQAVMSIDMAYQYRWGSQVEGEIIQGENSPANVTHHLLYISLIYYFKGKPG